MNLPQVLNTGVSPSFRATFNIPLKAGVDLTEQDDRDDATAVLVNSAFVKTFFPNESAIGKRIRYAPDLNPQAQWEQIVGVIGDTRQSSFDEASDPELYRPLARNISLRPAIVMRTVDNPLLHQRDIESALHDVDSELPIFSPRTMEQIEARRLGLRSFITTLLTGFALIAVLLSCGGIFAVIAYSISQRTSEIGVRMAFGATAGDISRMIALQALIPAFSGIGAGLALAFLLNRYLSKLPFAVENASFPAYSGAVVLLALCSTVAALLPARRAALTDPWTALHYE
jgi:hypothetical protein